MENTWTHYGGIANRIFNSLYLLLPYHMRMKIGTKQFESYFKFGFVRNPWDRVVSLYERREGLQMRGKLTFDAFVEWIKYSSSTCIHPVPHRNQLDWFVDPNGNVIVDFIGRFENLQDDWAFILKKLGIDKQLPQKKVTPMKKHYSEYYTDETRRIIAEKFRVDIQYFGYKFIN